tara:strand:- start:936 stop:1316 length:381 start_codon:yes stop_codon:yes gene_type:complete
MPDGKVCGAEHRKATTHRLGMSREEHSGGATDYRTDTNNHLPYGRPKNAIEAMDEAVRDAVAQEDEAATMAPPTPSSDQTQIELKAIRLDPDNRILWVVFEIAGNFYHGPLPELQPADLIKEKNER